MVIRAKGFVGTAEDGSAVTGDMISSWDSAYTSGELPGKVVSAERHAGRPRLVDDDMDTITIRLPKAQKEAVRRKAASLGMTTSGYVRKVLATQR